MPLGGPYRGLKFREDLYRICIFSLGSPFLSFFPQPHSHSFNTMSFSRDRTAELRVCLLWNEPRPSNVFNVLPFWIGFF